MSNLNLLFFVCACSSDGDLETQTLDYEIDHESLSVMISEEIIQYGDQYNIYVAQDFASNPIMELDLFNHSSAEISLTEGETAWVDSPLVEFSQELPTSIPEKTGATIELTWRLDLIEEALLNANSTSTTIPFYIPRVESFGFDFHIEVIDSLDILFLGNGEYSLVSSENTNDFVHEQWNSSRESGLVFGGFYLKSFWRVDILEDENTSVFSTSEDGLNWTEQDMGLTGTPEFCQSIDTSFICFTSENIWASFEGKRFETISNLEEVPPFFDGVSHQHRGFLLSNNGVYALYPSGYYEQVYDTPIQLQSIATNVHFEMVVVGEQSILYSDDGQNWNQWDVFSSEGQLHHVQSFDFGSTGEGWIAGVEHEGDYTIWKIGEDQFEQLAEFKLIDVANNMIFAVDDSHWVYRSKNGSDWEKIHRLPSHVVLRTVVMEERVFFEGVE
jgi:hypothetical protein